MKGVPPKLVQHTIHIEDDAKQVQQPNLDNTCGSAEISIHGTGTDRTTHVCSGFRAFGPITFIKLKIFIDNSFV